MKKLLAVIMSVAIVLTIGGFALSRNNETEISIAPAYSGNSEETIESMEMEFEVAEERAIEASENPVSDNKGNAFGYVVVTDTIPADGKTDVADAIQALIDANPNRTIEETLNLGWKLLKMFSKEELDRVDEETFNRIYGLGN